MSVPVPAGTPIAVVAPSGVFDPERLARGVEVAAAAGHTLVPFPDLLHPVRYLASADDKRRADLGYAMQSPEYGAVWIARGGFGLTRIIDRLPWRRTQPKTIIGFSDATPLLDAMWRATGAVQIHGPVLHSLAETSPAARAHLFALLAGERTAPLRGEPWVSGSAEGRLVGGNLSLLAATCGTRWQLDSEGAILALEDVGEAPYRIDRMLQQLKQAGVLGRAAGIALGTWEACTPPREAAWSLEEVLREHVEGLGIPVVAGLPFGHGRENFALPIGARARLSDGALTWELGAAVQPPGGVA